MVNLIDKINTKITAAGDELKNMYDFVRSDPKERFRRAAPDMLSLSLPNTLVFGNIEQYVGGMSPLHSAEMRIFGALTSPLYGLLRDYDRHKKGVDVSHDKKAEKKVDYKVGLKIGLIEFGINMAKYGTQKMINGEHFDEKDVGLIAVSFIGAAYTYFAGGFNGRVIETTRAGLGIDKENNDRSYIPKEMKQKDKLKRVTLLGAASAAILGGFYFIAKTTN